MEVAKLTPILIKQQILCHKSGFMDFFKINIESLPLAPDARS